MELDYLAPFLAQLGDPPTLTKMQASKLKSDCLADLKQRLIDKANLIQVGNRRMRENGCHIKFVSFLDASSHLYKRVCPSVGWSVGRSVRPSVRP